MADDRAYTGGRFVLELDSQAAGLVNSVEGGNYKSETIAAPVGAGSQDGRGPADFYVTKYAGRPRYDDIAFTVGTVLSPRFFKWIKASLENRPERLSGALVSYDSEWKERSRRSFYNALLGEVGFPGLDGAAKSVAALTVKVAPERVVWEAGRQTKIGGIDSAKDQIPKQKKWVCQNFSITLDRINQKSAIGQAIIDPFTVKQNVINNPVGHELEPRREVGRLELPTIGVSVPEATAKPWMEWWDLTVRRGDRKGQTTSGVISYKASDLSEIMSVQLDGVSLLSLDTERYDAMKEGIARVKAQLHVESLVVEAGPGTVS